MKASLFCAIVSLASASSPILGEHIGIYGQMITLFTDCILQDRQPPTSLANGRHSVKVVNAIYQAVRERRVVEVGA